MKGVAALRAKLMERNVPSRREESDETPAQAFFTAPSLPNLPTQQVCNFNANKSNSIYTRLMK